MSKFELYFEILEKEACESCNSFFIKGNKIYFRDKSRWLTFSSETEAHLFYYKYIYVN